MSGPGAIPCWKLFVPFLPSFASVDSLIFLDSDILLLQDPRLLWAHFGHFLPTHVLGLALNHDGMTGETDGGSGEGEAEGDGGDGDPEGGGGDTNPRRTVFTLRPF